MTKRTPRKISPELQTAINKIGTPKRAIEYLELIGEYRVSIPGSYTSIVPNAKDILAVASIAVLKSAGYDAPKLVSEDEAPEYAKQEHAAAPEAWFILRATA